MKTICENCKLKNDCSYLNRGMERDCIDVQTWEDGYDAAVRKAKKWIEDHTQSVAYLSSPVSSITQWRYGDTYAELFEKAMETV